MSPKSLSGARLARVALAVAALAVALLALPAVSSATMPGLNGRIAFNQLVSIGEGPGTRVAIWSMNADGSGAGRLTSLDSSESATYSPNGSRIAFEHEAQIWVAAADGSDARLLVDNSSNAETRTRWEQNVENPDTGETFPWAKIEERRDFTDGRFGPKFSPGGSALLVDHFTGTEISTFVCEVAADQADDCLEKAPFYEEGCEDCGSSIETIDANTGTPLATLVPRVIGVFVYSPAYSSSGAIAFTQFQEGEEDKLVVIPSPGAPPVTVASSDDYVSEADFSPDGSRLAFVSGDHLVGIVPATGGAAAYIELPQPSAGLDRWYAASPIWSPDGTRIAVGDYGYDAENTRLGGVYAMGPDGSGITEIRGEGAVPTSWQPIPRPAPAPAVVRARSVKGKAKLKLNKKGIAVVGKVLCGSSPCGLKATKSKLKLGKRSYGVKAVLAKSLAAGATGQVKVKVKGKALTALKAKHGGKLALTVAVTDAAGSANVAFSPKLLPPAAKKSKSKR